MFWALALISLGFAAVPVKPQPAANKGKAPAKAAAKTVAKATAARVPTKAPPPRSAAKPGVATHPTAAVTRTTPANRTAAPAVRGRVQQPQYSRYSTNSRNRHQIATSQTTTVRPRPAYHPAQAAPTPDRYKEIQSALVQKGYLTGEPSGAWDANSVDAMKRFQKDQNLEADGKLSSLSLIALGLGPKHTLTASAASPPAPVPVPGTTNPVPPKP